jgi:outer membrane protein OmpA-like peptidoglycan-associated protein
MNLKLTLLLSAFAGAALPQAASAVERDSNIILAQQAPAKNEATPEERKNRRDNNEQSKPAGGNERGQNNRAQNPQENRQDNRQNNRPQDNKAPDNRAQDNRQENKPDNRAAPTHGNDKTPAAQNRQQPNTPPAVQNRQQPNTPPAANNQNQNAPQNQNTQQKQTTPAPAQPKRDNQPAAQQNNQPANKPAANTPPTTAPAAKPTAETPARDNPQNKKIEAVRSERKETREGDRTVIRENNRTIVKVNNTTIIRHDETDRFRHGGGDVHVERRGNNTETVIVRPGGVRIVNTVDAQGRLLRRSRIVNGREVVLINNRYDRPASGFGFIVQLPPPVIRIPRERYIVEYAHAPRPWIYETLIAPPVVSIERPFTLDEVRYNYVVRERMPRIDIDTINFETGSWEVAPDQARLLEPIAQAMQEAIHKSPNEIYLVEGHTDAVGSTEDNLSLSDRRAEAVAEVLTANFQIPPENLTTQGYGEQNLKVETQGPEPRNRYVTVRRITPLLMGQK